MYLVRFLANFATFLCVFVILRDFTELLEICGSVIVQNIGSPDYDVHAPVVFLNTFNSIVLLMRQYISFLFTWSISLRNIVVTLFSEQPQITVKPQSQTLKEDDKAILNCKATSKPPSKISWLKGGDPIKQDGRVSVLANGSIVINKLVPQDSGKYRCSADHDGGWSDSAEANLTVMG